MGFRLGNVDFLKKLIRGDIPLWKTFWFGGILTIYIMTKAVRFLTDFVFENVEIWYFTNFTVALVIPSFSLYVWMVIISISIWRSANNHTNNRLWSFLSKCASPVFLWLAALSIYKDANLILPILIDFIR